MRTKACRLRGFAGLFLMALAQYSRADIPLALDRFSAAFGGFYPSVDTRVSLSGPQLAGLPIDFERSESLDNHRTLPNLHVEWLVFDSQGFSIGGYQYSKTEGTRFTRDFEFDGSDYHVDAHAEAGLRIYTYNAAWHWWFAPSAHDVIGAGLGAVYYKIKGMLSAGIAVNDASIAGSTSAETSAVAPLLTLAWRHAFSENLRAYVDCSGVRKSFGTVTGHLVNATVGAEWYPFHNLGFALEYSSNALSLKATKQEWQARASIDFRGPAAFVRMRF